MAYRWTPAVILAIGCQQTRQVSSDRGTIITSPGGLWFLLFLLFSILVFILPRKLVITT